MKKIGVLALQGAFAEHVSVFNLLGTDTRLVRLPEHLEGLDGLVIPGGESTTLRKLMASYGVAPLLADLIAQGLPVFGTCAGLIVLAKRIVGQNGQSFGPMDIDVRRNGFGRQVDSFETDIAAPALGETPFHAIFIRAPLIVSVGAGVEVLASLPDGTPVSARQGHLLVSAFHPELTDDLRFHRYFLDIVGRRDKSAAVRNYDSLSAPR